VTVTSYFLPDSLPEAIGLLEAHGPTLLVMAGGTVAMPLINEGLSLPERVMGLRRAGLDVIERRDGEVRIGATVTLTRLLEQEAIPLLREAAGRTGAWSVRNMATVGGNLFTPPPGGDVAVALLALDATVEIAGPSGTREVALSDFHTGFLTTVLGDAELVTGVRVPTPTGSTAFHKFGRKHANTPSVVSVAVRLDRERDTGRVTDVRIALGAVGPHPIRARRAERLLAGAVPDPGTIAAAAGAAAEDCEPFDDGVASAWYRRRMVRLFVGRTLEQALGSVEGGA